MTARAALALALVLTAPMAAADALTDFTAAARESYEACRAWDWGPSGRQMQTECMDKQKAALQPKFDAAQRAVAKNKAALSRLRDFYAFWRATFEDSMSREEPRPAYEKRTRDAMAAINERAIRLELEAKP